jgi:uncharacterized protein YndB with AHSA1/START domain
MSESTRQEVVIEGELDRVWQEVIDPSWLGSDGALDPTPGAEGHVIDEGQLRVLVVEEVVPAERLVFRWASFEESPSRVEIDVVPCGTGTRVTVTETPIVATASVGRRVGASAR